MNKKALVVLGVVAAAAMPAAAFAHVSVDLGIGLPIYSAPPAVVYEQPAPVYAPPPVAYAEPGYVTGPTVVYSPGYGYYGPHYGYGHYYRGGYGYRY